MYNPNARSSPSHNNLHTSYGLLTPVDCTPSQQFDYFSFTGSTNSKRALISDQLPTPETPSRASLSPNRMPYTPPSRMSFSDASATQSTPEYSPTPTKRSEHLHNVLSGLVSIEQQDTASFGNHLGLEAMDTLTPYSQSFHPTMMRNHSIASAPGTLMPGRNFSQSSIASSDYQSGYLATPAQIPQRLQPARRSPTAPNMDSRPEWAIKLNCTDEELADPLLYQEAKADGTPKRPMNRMDVDDRGTPILIETVYSPGLPRRQAEKAKYERKREILMASFRYNHPEYQYSRAPNGSKKKGSRGGKGGSQNERPNLSSAAATSYEAVPLERVRSWDGTVQQQQAPALFSSLPINYVPLPDQRSDLPRMARHHPYHPRQMSQRPMAGRSVSQYQPSSVPMVNDASRRSYHMALPHRTPAAYPPSLNGWQSASPSRRSLPDAYNFHPQSFVPDANNTPRHASWAGIPTDSVDYDTFLNDQNSGPEGEQRGFHGLENVEEYGEEFYMA
ncbi:hypothetical protein P7C73_g4850, partial [Tremellales sp. Uapishka_1]